MPKRPHVVLLMADHLRFDCLSCYGDLGVRTPNLDALAAESVIFERAYCSTPLCTPTRISLACGKWPHTTRAIVNGGSFPTEIPFRELGPEHRTYYEQLAEGGYAVGHVGVHHVRSVPPVEERAPGVAINRGVDRAGYLREHGLSEPLNDAAKMPTPEFENGSPSIKFYHPPEHVEPTAFAAEHFLDCYWARCMAEQVRAADPARPHAWFFHAWAPHPPFFVPEPYFSMYDPAAIRLPETVGRWYEGTPPTMLYNTGPFRAAHLDREGWRRTWAAYFGLVSMVDDCLGRVIRALKEQGFWDDALVIFTQDHGDSLGCHRMFQKMSMFEPSARIPLLIKPPGGAGAAAGSRRSPPVGHVDLAPTICDYAGLPPLPDAWGQSLRGLIHDPNAPWRDATFCEFNGDHGRGWPSRAIITDRYKYVYNFGSIDQLYDLREDPNETRSLVGLPEHQALRRELRRRVGAWMRETDDMLDLDRHADFHPALWRRFDRWRGWL